LYENEKIRTEMQRNSKLIGRPEASARVVDIAMSLLKQATVRSYQPKGEKYIV
jgi:hypothetical protein